MELGQYVEGVMVEVMSSDLMMVYIINDGFFELLGVFFGGSYMVCFEWNVDFLNGVFILDLMFISCYILGVQFLNMFYKMIVVDVNCFGFIFILDIIVLCKMILGLESELFNGNIFWWFVDVNYIFLNLNNFFVILIFEVVNINGFDQDYMDVNFVVIKVGDVDFLVVFNDFSGVEECDLEGSMMVYILDVSVNEGQEFIILFIIMGLYVVLGYQFILCFNIEVLEYMEFVVGLVFGMLGFNFNLQKMNDGWIIISWN